MGTTTLCAAKANDGRIECHFRGRNGGTKYWQWITDRFRELVNEQGEACRLDAEFPDGEMFLGRGARVLMPIKLYVAVRLKLAKYEHAANAIKNGSFLFDDSDFLTPTRFKLIRAKVRLRKARIRRQTQV